MIKSAMVRFDKLLAETPKAYLVRIEMIEYWVPKSLCKRFVTNNKLGGNIILPTFFINKMLDIDINIDLPKFITPEWIIEKHIPEKINPLKSNDIKDLKR